MCNIEKNIDSMDENSKFVDDFIKKVIHLTEEPEDIDSEE